MNKYQVATAKEDGRVLQEYGVTWDASKVSTMQQHRRKPIKVAGGVRKRKGYIGIHHAAHAPAEWSHGENIFLYQVMRVSNDVKCKTQ